MQYIAYSRCSTEEQGKKGHSHDYQVDGIRRSGAVTIGSLGEVGYYQDTVSGTRFDNRASGLDAAYKLCERNRGVVKFLFVYRWDRLGRDVSDCFQCIKKFREIGVEVNCPDEFIDFKDPSFPLILSVKFGMAQSESMRISDRTRDGIHQANMAGIWTGKAPVGYRKAIPRIVNGKERTVCDPVPGIAPFIVECFERYAAGETKAELFARFGASLGIAKSQFCRIFHNPFYAGLVFVKAHRNTPAQMIQGVHQALISMELYEACQKVLETNDHTTLGKTWNLTHTFSNSEFWLKGVIKCADSWRNMTAYKSKGKSGRRFGYYAAQKMKGGQIIPVDKAHHLASESLRGFRIDSEVQKELRTEIQRQLSDRIQSARKLADTAKRSLDRVNQRIQHIQQEYADKMLSSGEYREMKSGFDREAVALDAQIISAQTSMADNDSTVDRLLDLLTGIDTVFAASSPEYKNRILKAVFPEGISIDQKAQKVRTPCVNEIILSICSKSIPSYCLEIENGTTFSSCPTGGGQSDRYRTHLNLLKLLFAA